MQVNALDHVALDCSGHDEVLTRLGECQAPVWTNEEASIGLRRIITCAPNGVLLEPNSRRS